MTPEPAAPGSAAPVPVPAPAPARRVAVAALAAAVVAAPLHAVVAAVATGLGAEPGGPLQPRAYVALTVLGTFAGAVGWHRVRTRADDAARTLRRLVPAVLAASLLPVAAVATQRGWQVGVALAVMHAVTAAVAVAAYAWLLPVRAHDARSRTVNR